MPVPSVSPHFMEAVFEYLQSQGFDETVVLGHLGIKNTQQLVFDNRVPLPRYEALFELGERLTGDRYFGLNMGASPMPKSWGLVSHLAMCAPNALVAISAFMNYSRLQLDFVRFTADELADGTWVLSPIIDSPKRPNRHVIEHMFANIIELANSQVGYSPVQFSIDFRHQDAGDRHHVEKLLHARVKFSREKDQVFVPEKYLNQLSPFGQEDLFSVTEKLARQRLLELQGKDPLINATRQVILEKLPNGLPKIDNVARTMGMSPRSLQRRLRERAVKYQTLLDEVRHELARQLIAKPELTLSEVADYLAFNDQSAFQHAFFRWEGTTPGQFRRAELQ